MSFSLQTLFTNIDAFGVPISLTFKREQQYKSPISGMFSLLIYIVSIVYAINILVYWKNGDMLPKSQTQTKYIDYIDVDLEEGFFQLGMYPTGSPVDSINPFSQYDNILLPCLYESADNFNFSKVIFSTSVKTANNQNPRYMVQLDSLKLVFQNYSKETNSQVRKEYFLIITICHPDRIKGYGTCASESVIKNYLDNLNPVMDLSIKIKQFNPQTQSYDIISKTQYMAVEQSIVTYSQLLFQVSETNINDGLFTDNINKFTYINNYEIANQQVSKNYAKMINGSDALAFFFMRLDSMMIKQDVKFPMIGEILAQIGSVIQMLFLTSYIFKYLNYKLLEHEIVDKLMSIYYQDWDKIQYFGISKYLPYKIKLNHKTLNIQAFDKFKKAIADKLIFKLDVINLLHQIIKIQSLLTETQSKEKIQEIILKQLKLSFSDYEDCAKWQIQPVDNENEEAQISISDKDQVKLKLENQELIEIFDYKINN
ncbi:hypothetical protein pb186bvf_006560 [Paramecium bursaria]